MSAYYNEFDPFAAQWLRNLIAAGHIAAGDVDERSIVEVQPDDVRGYTQAHFFAGLGGWSYALRLGRWDDERPVWTGSCPCQPFSAAGKQRGEADARHLWPEFRRLIAECRPASVFGEQVASALGRGWLAAVRADLEELGYAVGAADLCAAGVGAPHIRQRLWWVADAEHRRREGRQPSGAWAGATLPQGSADRLGIAAGAEPGERADAQRPAVERGGETDWVVLADGKGSSARSEAASATRQGRPIITAGWHDLEWLPCRDGKARPTKPGIQPLAHGVSARVGKMRAAGNAIVPQVAAAFISAAMECAP